MIPLNFDSHYTSKLSLWTSNLYSLLVGLELDICDLIVVPVYRDFSKVEELNGCLDCLHLPPLLSFVLFFFSFFSE